MAHRPLIFWAISLPAIILQLGIKISCNGHITTQIAPIPPARADDTSLTIPGCEVRSNFDCLVAQTAFLIPEYCKTYAITANCITYLSWAFCGDIDLPAVQNDTTPLQNCINAIPSGPCSYNTSGRACTSGLFSNFKFMNDPDPPRLYIPPGGGPGPEFQLQLDSPEAIFGGESDPTWDPSIWTTQVKRSDLTKQGLYNLGQFIIGVFKNIGNAFIGLAKMALGDEDINIRLECAALRKNASTFWKKKAIIRGCKVYYKLMGNEYDLRMNNGYQKASNIFAIIVGIIMPAVDAAEALGITAKVAEYFNVESVAEDAGAAESMVLRANRNGNTAVEIWAQGENGYRRPMTRAEAETLKADLAKGGFKNLVSCEEAPGGLRKRMNVDLPFVPCAPLAAELGVDLGMEPAEGLEGPEAAENANQDVDAIFADLDDIVNLDQGSPPAVNEVELPPEPVQVQEALGAQDIEAYGVQAVARADHYFEDLSANWLDGPQVEGEGWDFDEVPEDGQPEFVLPNDLPNDPPEDPVAMLLAEAGPADPQQFEAEVPLQGFDVPQLPALNNLPVLMTFPGDWEIINENVAGLNEQQYLAFANAGTPEQVFQRILDAFQNRYLQGLPAFDGAPLNWVEQSLVPPWNDVNTLADEFQSVYGLSAEFMATVDGLQDGAQFRMMGRLENDLDLLPRFEGIAHFWQSQGAQLATMLLEITRTRGRSYFRIDGIGLRPRIRMNMRFMRPGFPIEDKPPNDKLFIILTRSARLIGPALRIRRPANLIYGPSESLFRYVGQMTYKYNTPSSRLSGAYIIQEIPTG